MDAAIQAKISTWLNGHFDQQTRDEIMKLQKENPDQLADLIACTLLPEPNERQIILETPNLETRLKCLIHFLMAEIQLHRKPKKS